MPLFQIILVALIQGLTEFLPVSSSGHLILLPGLTSLDDQGLLIDVAVHVGTLGAVMLYFRDDVRLVAGGTRELMRGQVQSQAAFFALCLGVATIPVIIAGIALQLSGLAQELRSVTVIGWTMLIFGLVLYWADQTGASTRTARDWSLRDAFIMGLWQAVALIPGTSRSGITITGGRRLGYERTDATRLAMLMSIPAILASGLVLGAQVVADGNWRGGGEALLAAVLAFMAAFVALEAMMRLLRYVSFTPYVIYRVVLGTALLIYAYS